MSIKLWLPLVLAAAFLGAGSVAIMLLPEPAGQPLQDYISESMRDTAAVGMAGTHQADEELCQLVPAGSAPEVGSLLEKGAAGGAPGEVIPLLDSSKAVRSHGSLLRRPHSLDDSSSEG